MLNNINVCGVALTISVAFIATCQSLSCHDDQNTFGNTTCRVNDNFTEYCVILKNSTSGEWRYSCDEDHLCVGKQEKIHYHICNGEAVMSFYCCRQDLCNKDQAVDISHHNFTCSSESSCSSNYCINVTVEDSTRIIINTSVECFYGQNGTFSNSNETILNGHVMKTLLLNLSTTCDNFTTPANHPTKGEFQEGSKTIISSPSTLDAKNGFSAGVVIGAILVMATGLMLVGVGVKKCYERHLNRRLEYSYAQLTIDMLDDDDDHLILP